MSQLPHLVKGGKGSRNAWFALETGRSGFELYELETPVLHRTSTLFGL